MLKKIHEVSINATLAAYSGPYTVFDLQELCESRKKGFEKAIKHADNGSRLLDYSDLHYLWLRHEAVALGFAERTNNGLVLTIVLAAGKKSAVISLERDVFSFAELNDFEGVTFRGRLGWERVFRDYKPVDITLYKACQK